MSAPIAKVQQATTPRAPTLDPERSAGLADEELRRFVRQLDTLTPDDGARPTTCPEWDVTAMARHVLGMTQMFASWPQNARQHLAAARAAKAGAVYIDALTAKQVSDRAGLDLAAISALLARTTPRNVRWRRRAPMLLRRRAMPDPQLVNGRPGAPSELWSFGFLFDTVLTRDTWMHRSDIALATGRPLELSANHDGVLVDQVVLEWAARHQQPYDLTLTGAAGGHWAHGEHGDHGEALELDAVEFCRVLSGRGDASGLLAVGVPF